MFYNTKITIYPFIYYDLNYQIILLKSSLIIKFSLDFMINIFYFIRIIVVKVLCFS